MFSNSASYLGGAQSSRPIAPQYGQPSFQNPSQAQQQSISITQQPTGFAHGRIQPQSFQAPLQQSAYTGLAPSTQPSFQGQASIQQIPQPNQPLQQSLSSQRTGQTSSQIAQSFQLSAPSQSSPVKISSTGAKIPKIRLSFLTAQDQAKFEQLFKSAVGEEQALDGDKVKDLLIRSKLPGSDLMHIWVLSDTTKSGQLLFPEFALAMYLCNLKLVGKELPRVLPERITNEVSSMVDIISFGVPDDRPLVASRSNAPNFNASTQPAGLPQIQQPQPQASNMQLLAQMTSQPTGFASQYIPPQPTGYQQPQPTGAESHPITFLQQQQQTGLQQNPQIAAYSGPRPPMPPMPSGLMPSYPQAPQGGPAVPLNAQPTGRPGQWGLVNAPAAGLPNIDALQQRMMPQPGREGGYTTAGLSGTATVPWAVTKDEKKIYDQLFKAWDGFNKGFISGEAAIEVMSQSGLEKPDLERIWTLSDPSNKGRLDMDEFAVAMHLIYRKLNGYPVPNRLPPELVPPSTRNFSDSIGTVKSLLSHDAETRKNSGAFLQPQKTGVSYLKTHSFREDSNGVAPGRKDATVFRNNDNDVGYKSSARRRLGAGGRTPSPVPPSSPTSDTSNGELTIEQLRKLVREKQILVDAIDFKDENAVDEDDALDRKDRREADELYRRIRQIQQDIDSHPSAALRNVDSGAERRTLKRQLQALIDRLPELASHVRHTERSIADAKLELFRLKDAKSYPGNASAVLGTGPGGLVTEADRLKARAKAMMQQRSAALTGRPTTTSTDDTSAASSRLEAESSKIRAEKENNEHMIKDVENGVRDFSRGLEDSLKGGEENSSTTHERRRWEDALGVEDEVKDFIFDIQRSSRTARIRQEDRGRQDPSGPNTRSAQDGARNVTSLRYDDSSANTSNMARHAAAPLSAPSPSYSSYKTAEERASFIKQQAEQRMAERLAALGLKPPTKTSESGQQKHEREVREREERLNQAAEEDAKRDEERRRRLAEEQPTPPFAANLPAKKPPLPPSRKSRPDSVDQQTEVKHQAEEDFEIQILEQEGKREAVKKQLVTQEAETRDVRDDIRRQEEDLLEAKTAAEARLRVLEEQVKAGKVRKQDEKRRKQAAEKEAKEKVAKVAAQRAELEAAKERERQLQLQLESLADEDSSDDEANQETTPQENTPTSSQFLIRDSTPHLSTHSSSASEPLPIVNIASLPVPELRADSTTPKAQSPTHSTETNNPFFKKPGQSVESSSTPVSQPTSSITSPSINEASRNPFHRFAQQESAESAAKAVQPLTSTPTGNRPSRIRPEDDDWSVVDSTEDSSDDDERDKSTGVTSKKLASMLFGTMGPPARPLSATDEMKSPRVLPTSGIDAPPTSPPPSQVPDMLVPSGPPPPPPMPVSFGDAPSVPPPPPPPPSGPSTGVTKVGPPAVGALLGEITKGKGLRKVETKDRSQSSVAGRVLN